MIYEILYFVWRPVMNVEIIFASPGFPSNYWTVAAAEYQRRAVMNGKTRQNRLRRHLSLRKDRTCVRCQT